MYSSPTHCESWGVSGFPFEGFRDQADLCPNDSDGEQRLQDVPNDSCL